MLRSLLFAASIALGSLVTANPISVEHAQGQLELKQLPQRVVVFDIGILDSLDALGVEVIGVPKDFVPPHLAKYKADSYAHIGSLFEPDYETLAALQPDLILVANRSAAVFNDLQKIAPTADFTVWGENYLEQFYQRTTKLGTIFNQAELAAAQIASIQQKLSKAQSLAQEAGNALLVMTTGGRLTAFGPGSRYAILHDEVGLASVATDLEKASHGDPISFEYVLQKNPDYLFVLDRDGAIDSAQAAAKATMDNELIKQTQAYQNDRVIYLDSVNWYIVMSGTQAVEGMLDEVIAALIR